MAEALWSASEAAQATGGKAQGRWVSGEISIDSRSIQPGELFAAIAGERFDGHDFVKAALARGAAAAMVSRIPSGVAEGAPLLIVPDTLEGLRRLGARERERAQARIVAVTGSVGKTSAKEALRIALSACGETFASRGNLNNHIGTPLNLANLPPAAQFGAFELGMNHPGEIEPLAKLVRPHAALITTVEAVHLEFFRSVEEIADAKAEIFTGLEPGGVAILNIDNAHAPRLRLAAERAGASRVIGFGSAERADCRLLDYRMTEFGSEVVASIGGTPLTYRLGSIGRHWALLSVGVLAAVDALDGDLPRAAAALANFREMEGRGRLVRIAVKGGQATLIDDSYNASPAAMRVAFEKLAAVHVAQGGRGRKVAALGDMRELGEQGPLLHRELAVGLKEWGVDKVFTAGEIMRHLHEALPAPTRARHAPSAAALTPLLRESLLPEDVVLVKGSHGSKMYEVAHALVGDAEAAGGREKVNAV